MRAGEHMPGSTKKKRCIDIKSGIMLCHFWRTITPVARAVKVLWGINRATVNCQRVPRCSCIIQYGSPTACSQNKRPQNKVGWIWMTGPTVVQTHFWPVPLFDHSGGANHSTFPDVFPVSEDVTV